MKHLILFSLVTLSVEAFALGPASGLLKSVGVIGPKGEVILYYREGDQIVIKNCAPLTVLGTTPAQAKASCQGNTNKVPVAQFRELLKASISTAPLNHMKPLTAAEVDAYKKSGIASDKIQAMMEEVEKINRFIAAYRGKNAPVARLDELMKTLSDHKTHAAAITKINAEIEKAINLITDENQLKLVDAETNDCNGDTERPFLYTALKSFDMSKIPCGQKGSVDERIKDCAKAEGAKKGNYALVSRTAKGQEVWKDTESGLVWSDRLASSMSQYDAQKACKNGLEEMAGISSDWKLPTREQYETANANGIRGALPKMSYWFWSSSVLQSNASKAWLFGGYYGYVNNYYRSSSYSVRCVAR